MDDAERIGTFIPVTVEREADLDELANLARQREEARGLLLDMLRAPWSRMSPWAITNACVYLEHPSKVADEDRGCPCGRRKDPR